MPKYVHNTTRDHFGTTLKTNSNSSSSLESFSGVQKSSPLSRVIISHKNIWTCFWSSATKGMWRSGFLISHHGSFMGALPCWTWIVSWLCHLTGCCSLSLRIEKEHSFSRDFHHRVIRKISFIHCRTPGHHTEHTFTMKRKEGFHCRECNSRCCMSSIVQVSLLRLKKNIF
ncbi:uncharacterized protein [Montipora capricornis]|uniref:uncharacterized protein isoform X1 n=1 Tax=Montipora capricornis TaxID=246305 RepID=UPI0035F0FD84